MMIPHSKIEIWKDIPGYEGLYKASNFGNIKSLDRVVPHHRTGSQFVESRTLKASITKSGYLTVALYKKAIFKRCRIHRLVMAAFKGQSKMDIDHINAIKTDNRLVNLRYCNGRENVTWYTNTLDKTSKFTGVCWCKKQKTWQAQITKNGKKKWLGYHETQELASIEYQKELP